MAGMFGGKLFSNAKIVIPIPLNAAKKKLEIGRKRMLAVIIGIVKNIRERPFET
jgi:hypothetical protein